jgi:hypothetical protein
MVMPDIEPPGPYKQFGWGGNLWQQHSFGRPPVTKRGPLTHILDTGAYWTNLELGVDTTADFILAAVPYFTTPGSPTLQQGDTIVGKDKNGTMVTILVVQIPANPQENEQQAPP